MSKNRIEEPLSCKVLNTDGRLFGRPRVLLDHRHKTSAPRRCIIVAFILSPTTTPAGSLRVRFILSLRITPFALHTQTAELQLDGRYSQTGSRIPNATPCLFAELYSYVGDKSPQCRHHRTRDPSSFPLRYSKKLTRKSSRCSRRWNDA